MGSPSQSLPVGGGAWPAARCRENSDPIHQVWFPKHLNTFASETAPGNLGSLLQPSAVAVCPAVPAAGSMGCGGSKPADDEDDGKVDIGIDLAKLEKAQSAARDNLNAKEGLQKDSSRQTASGYQTDMASDRPAFTQAFVHSHAGRRAVRELEDKYETDSGSILGRGACGSVVAVRHRTTKELFAMKVVSLETVGGSLEELKREIEIQKTLDHPNICKIFESYEDTTNKEVYIIMEICTGGSLVSRMKYHKHGYGERSAATLVEKILSSILYCHHHGTLAAPRPRSR